MQFTEEGVSQRDLMRFSDVFMADPAGESLYSLWSFIVGI